MPHSGRTAGFVEIFDGRTFMVSDSCGDVADSITGLFHDDTRHLSRFVLTIGGQGTSS